MKILKNVSMFIISIYVLSCTQTKKKYQWMNFRDEFNIKVIKKSSKYDALILNDSFVVGKESQLIYIGYKPKWLFEKANQSKILDTNNVITPKIKDIDPPYEITKPNKNNNLILIKNKDTLRFYLTSPENFSAIQDFL